MQEQLERERDQCRRLVETERRDAAAARDKLTAQIAQLKCASEQVNQLNVIFIKYTFFSVLMRCWLVG